MTPAEIVLVDVDRERRDRLERLLSEQGYQVASAPSFHRAKELLDSLNPDLLITCVRLDAFNGLHLVIRTRQTHSTLPIIVTDVSTDPVIEAEVWRQGAAHVTNPLENPEFLHTVKLALAHPRGVAVDDPPGGSQARMRGDRSTHGERTNRTSRHQPRPPGAH